jgi:hypothetical protein
LDLTDLILFLSQVRLHKDSKLDSSSRIQIGLTQYLLLLHLLLDQRLQLLLHSVLQCLRLQLLNHKELQKISGITLAVLLTGIHRTHGVI